MNALVYSRVILFSEGRRSHECLGATDLMSPSLHRRIAPLMTHRHRGAMIHGMWVMSLKVLGLLFILFADVQNILHVSRSGTVIYLPLLNSVCLFTVVEQLSNPNLDVRWGSEITTTSSSSSILSSLLILPTDFAWLQNQKF